MEQRHIRAQLVRMWCAPYAHIVRTNCAPKMVLIILQRNYRGVAVPLQCHCRVIAEPLQCHCSDIWMSPHDNRKRISMCFRNPYVCMLIVFGWLLTVAYYMLPQTIIAIPVRIPIRQRPLRSMLRSLKIRAANMKATKALLRRNGDMSEIMLPSASSAP